MMATVWASTPDDLPPGPAAGAGVGLLGVGGRGHQGQDLQRSGAAGIWLCHHPGHVALHDCQAR